MPLVPVQIPNLPAADVALSVLGAGSQDDVTVKFPAVVQGGGAALAVTTKSMGSQLFTNPTFNADGVIASMSDNGAGGTTCTLASGTTPTGSYPSNKVSITGSVLGYNGNWNVSNVVDGVSFDIDVAFTGDEADLPFLWTWQLDDDSEWSNTNTVVSGNSTGTIGFHSGVEISLEEDHWYKVTVLQQLNGDISSFYFDNVSGYFVDAANTTAFTFQASNSEDDIFWLDYDQYEEGATRTVSSVSIIEIEEPQENLAVTDVAGSLSLAMRIERTIFGYGAGASNSGNNVTFIGELAGQLNQGENVIGIGYAAGIGNQANTSIFIGKMAGFFNDAVAINNVTLIGHLAGLGNSGQLVTGVGEQALQLNTGLNNTAIGRQAGKSNTGYQSVFVGSSTGSGNSGNDVVAVGHIAGVGNNQNDVTAVGAFAGASNHGSELTAFGKYAGNSNEGAEATVIGWEAGRSNTGDSLTAVGLLAGKDNVGNNNTVIGRGTVVDGSFENSSAIGSGAAAGASNRVQLGNGNVDSLVLGDQPILLGDLLQAKTNTPASASATGVAGTICWDADYIYICVATDIWKRVAIATW